MPASSQHNPNQSFAPASNLEAEATRLAELPPLEYDTVRKEEATRLGVRSTTLDEEVRRRRQSSSGSDREKGRQVRFTDPEPWPEAVDGNALLDEISALLRRHVVLRAGDAEIIAAWILHCYAFDCFPCTPRLNIHSPEKQCGKTVLLDVIEALTPKSIRTENLSTAVLFRLIDEHQPTVLIDEVDTFLKGNEDLRGALNAGHRRGGQHLRCVGDSNEVRAFRTFAPVATAGIGRLHGTLADRSIPIEMRRRRSSEPIAEFRAHRCGQTSELRSKAVRWAADNREQLSHCDPDMPDGVFNRNADNWLSLIAIADAATGDWPDKIRELSVARCADDQTDDSYRTMLLEDIANLFEVRETDRLSSEDIVDHLATLEDRPWPEWRNAKPITKTQLARLLKPFGVSSTSVRLDSGATPKGYYRSAFDDAFARYLPDQSATPQQARISADLGENQNATERPVLRFENRQNAKDSADCGGVAFGKEGLSEEERADREERLAIQQFDGEQDEDISKNLEIPLWLDRRESKDVRPA